MSEHEKPKPAPVVLFVYARPDHTDRTIKALAANRGAAETDLIIYSDGPRGSADQRKVNETRQIASASEGFRSVTIIERAHNCGLAENIMNGVSEVCSHYGHVIVLEDDIVTSPGFLEYMNMALEAYRSQRDVWHISGWNYPIDPAGIDCAFLLRIMNCWGWATWDDRWKNFRRDPAALLSEFTAEQRSRFNLDNTHDFFAQIEANASGQIKTWAVFWYATIFRENGLCLNPARSLVANIGHDGTGENCGTQAAEQALIETTLEEKTESLTVPATISEDPIAIDRIRRHLRKSLLSRILTGSKRFLRGND